MAGRGRKLQEKALMRPNRKKTSPGTQHDVVIAPAGAPMVVYRSKRKGTFLVSRFVVHVVFLGLCLQFLILAPRNVFVSYSVLLLLCEIK